MNCEKCELAQVCCNADAWEIPLTTGESLDLIHTRLADGRTFISAGSDGYCFYRDATTGKCKIYDKRPKVCRDFCCDDKKSTMDDLIRKRDEAKASASAKYGGYFIAFVFSTEEFRSVSDLIVKNPKTGKEVKLTPQSVYGQTEEEVKKKMIGIMNEPFKKEDV